MPQPTLTHVPLLRTKPSLIQALVNLWIFHMEVNNYKQVSDECHVYFLLDRPRLLMFQFIKHVQAYFDVDYDIRFVIYHNYFLMSLFPFNLIFIWVQKANTMVAIW